MNGRALPNGIRLTDKGRALLQRWRDEEAARVALAAREAEHALGGTR